MIKSQLLFVSFLLLTISLFGTGFAVEESTLHKSDFVTLSDTFVSKQNFSGVVLVARDGRILFEKAYGLANREHDVPNKIDTKFRLGSVTKQFTAMAIMILVERGKLRITDPICNYVQDCPEQWKEITLKNLLTHTSGIPSFTDFPDNDRYERLPMTPLETIARFRDKPLEFNPGSQFKYSNSGYLLLGHIIEQVSGKKYEDFMRENIYDPLGMSNSGYDHPWLILKDRASGYVRKDQQWRNASLMEMDTPFAGGSMYSTVRDLLSWDQALYSNKLISGELSKEIFTPSEVIYPKGWMSRHHYGYGWFLTTWFGRKLVWHPGGIYGFCSVILRYPQDRTLVVVLENEEEDAEDLDLRTKFMTIANGLSAIAFGYAPDTDPLGKFR
jgi:CubicO group peptidase (beta-lactamase class C family)